MCWGKGITNQLNTEHFSSASDMIIKNASLVDVRIQILEKKTQLGWVFFQNCSLRLITVAAV